MFCNVVNFLTFCPIYQFKDIQCKLHFIEYRINLFSVMLKNIVGKMPTEIYFSAIKIHSNALANETPHLIG